MWRQEVQHVVSHLHFWIFPCKPSSSSLLVRHNLYLEAKRGVALVLRCTHLQEDLSTSWLIGAITVYGSRARYTGTPVKQPSNNSADPAAGGVSSRRGVTRRLLLAARHRDFHDRGVTRRHRLAASLSKLRCPTMCWGSEVTHGSGHHGLDSICSAMNLSAEDGSLLGRCDVLMCTKQGYH